MKKILLLSAILALFSIAALADIRPPQTPTPKKNSQKSIDTSLLIYIKKDAEEAKLIIPKSQLKQLRAELEQLDDSSDKTASLSFTRTQTIVSGMLLSLAFVFGGVWLTRSRKIDTKASKTLVICSVLFLSGTVATIVYANAGPPPEARRITGKMFSEAVHLYKTGSGKIKLETSDTVKSPTLIVPDVPKEQKNTDEE